MPQFITRDNKCPSLSDKLAGPETQAGWSHAPKAKKKVVLKEFTT